MIPAKDERHHARLVDRQQVIGDALEGFDLVSGHSRRIAGVDHRERLSQVDLEFRVEWPQKNRGAADRLWAETSSGTKRNCVICRHADDGGVNILEGLHER